MDFQNNQQVPTYLEPINRFPVWATILISFIVTAAIVSGGTYYYVNNKATTDKNNLQAQINDLNTKLATAEKSIADAQVSTQTATTTPTTTTTPDPTASWKTYTNTFYNFTFKYPTANEVKVISPITGSLDPVSSSQQDPDVYVMGADKTSYLFGFLSDGEFSVTDDSLISRLKLFNLPVGLKVLDTADFTVKKNVTVAGKSATKISIAANKLGGLTDAYDFYFIPSASGEIYRITVDSTYLGNHILSTFLFKE